MSDLTMTLVWDSDLSQNFVAEALSSFATSRDVDVADLDALTAQFASSLNHRLPEGLVWVPEACEIRGSSDHLLAGTNVKAEFQRAWLSAFDALAEKMPTS